MSRVDGALIERQEHVGNDVLRQVGDEGGRGVGVGERAVEEAEALLNLDAGDRVAVVEVGAENAARVGRRRRRLLADVSDIVHVAVLPM